jgi:hypothetical protein
MVTARSATHGVEALFIGFYGLIIGRNFAPRSRSIGESAALVPWSSATLFRVYVAVLFLSYLFMLVAVGFDPIELVNYMLMPRWSQPWARGTFGGWREIGIEFSGSLRYLIPAIAGSVLAKPSRFSFSQKAIVVLGLAFTLFYGFTSGTRNVFCTYLITFIMSYLLLKPDITWRRVIVLSCMTAGLLYLAAYFMLQFRNVGVADYVNSTSKDIGYKQDTLFIDNNLPVISRLTDVFPDRFAYLGSEFLSFAILHPVPRALWPGKPEGLSVSTADALGARGLSLSSTFVGEAFMMGGYSAILVTGLFFGWLGGWWNRFGSRLRSNVGAMVYASGCYAAGISMRSMLWTTVAMLPPFALWLYARSRGPGPRSYAIQPVGRKPST